MTAAPIASAYIRIRPDFGTFTEDTKATTDRATTAASGKVKIGADTGEAKVALDALKLRLDALKTQTAEAKVRLSGDDRARGQVDRLDFALRRLGLTVARPKINLEGVARAELQLEALQARLDAVNRGGGGGRRGLGGAESAFGRLPSGPGGLLGAALFAAPATVPIAGVGAGALASLLTPTGAGAIGLGLFGAASKSSITKIDTIVTKLAALHTKISNTPTTTTTTTKAASPASIQAAQARLDAAQGRLFSAQLSGGSGASVVSAQASVASAQASLAKLQGQGGSTTTANKQRLALLKQEHDLLKNLDPAQRQAVKNVQALDATWAAFQKHLQPQTFGALATGAGIVKTLLTDVEPLTVAVGNTVVGLEKQAGAAFKDPFWHQFFGVFLTHEAPLAVKTLGDVIGNVGTGIAHLMEGFAPLGHDAEHLAVTWSARFESWAAGQGPGKFVAFVEKEGPVVGKALLGIVDAVDGLGKGLLPLGAVELKALTPVLDFIGKLGDEHPAVITAVGGALLAVGAGLKVIAGVKGIEGILGGLGRLRGGGITGVLGGATAKLSEPVPVFVTNWHGGPGGVGGGAAAGGTAAAEAEAGGAAAATSIVAGLKSGLRTGLKRGATGLAVGLGGDALGSALAAHGHAGAGRAVRNSSEAYAALSLFGPEVAGSVAVIFGLASLLPGNGLGSGLRGADRSAFLNTTPTSLASSASTQLYLQSHPQLFAQFRQQLPNLTDTQLVDYIAGLRKVQGSWSAVGGTQHDVATMTVGDIKQQIYQAGLLSTSLDGVSAKAGTAGAALERKLGKVAGHVGVEIQRLADSLHSFLSAPVGHPAPASGGGVSRNNQQILGGGGRGSSVAPRVLSGSLSSGAQIGTSPVDPALANLVANAQTAGSVTALLGMVGRVQRQLQNELSNAQAKLSSDLASRQATASGIAGGITSAADIGGAYINGRVGNLAGFLGGFARSDKRLLRDERQLRLRHLDPRLLEQIANAGPTAGVAIAESVLSGRSGSIAHLSRLERQIYGSAQATGRSVGGALFDTRIQSDRAKVDRMVNALDELNSNIRAMRTILKDNPHDFAAALDALLRGLQHQRHAQVGH